MLPVLTATPLSLLTRRLAGLSLLITALLLLTVAPAWAADSSAIPLAEIGQRADAQQAPPAPVLDGNRAILAVPLQALRGELGPAGLTVESTSASEGGGRFRLTPASLSKGAAAVALPSGVVSLRERAVVLERGPLVEILTASGNGLRQDFVVKTRPPGAGDLTLTLAVAGATASQNGAHVTLTLPGQRELIYHGLHVIDARGTVLDATLTRQDDHTLTIAVRDAQAQYPLTIDPTLSDADWQVWNPGLPGANKSIYSLAVNADGTRLYAGGNFTAIGTVLANRIAQWDGSAWSALGSGVNNPVIGLAVAADGRLYAGGNFTTAGGAEANRIAQWNGSAWSTLGSGMDGSVIALTLSGGSLYAGGSFTTVGGMRVNNIARWDGSAWSALGSGMNNAVWTLAMSSGGLYAGGDFTSADGTAANRIARWDGSNWSALSSR